MVICAIFYPPSLNQVTTGTMLGLIYIYNFNSIISIFVLLKFYIALRAYSYFSRWTTDTAKSILNKHNVQIDLNFTVKAELKKRPLAVLTVMMIFSLGICSFVLRQFEYGVIDNQSNTTTNSLKGSTETNDLSTIANCMWLIIVTMTTVGYGDFYPKSHLGRFIGVISCIIGMLLVSLIVVSLSSILDFRSEEKKAYSIIKKLNADDNAYSKATDVIKSVLNIRKIVSEKRESSVAFLTERFILFTQLKRKITIFKNDYKIANSYALPIDEMLKRMENNLKDDISRIGTCVKNMSGINEQIDDINKDQDELTQRMNNILKMQEDISQYIVSFNNENFRVNLLKRFESNKKISISSKNLLNGINSNEIEKDVKLKNGTENIFNKIIRKTSGIKLK